MIASCDHSYWFILSFYFEYFALLYIWIAAMMELVAKMAIMYGENAASLKEIPLKLLLTKAVSGNPAHVRRK